MSLLRSPNSWATSRRRWPVGSLRWSTHADAQVVAGYIGQISEQMVAAYAEERENWLRNRSAARAARIRDLLSGERVDVSAAEATLGYRLRQVHVGLVCWVGDAASTADEINRLERAISHVAGRAWLPLGTGDTRGSATADMADMAGLDPDIHFAFGDAAKGATGFRITHQQASHWLGSYVLQELGAPT